MQGTEQRSGTILVMLEPSRPVLEEMAGRDEEWKSASMDISIVNHRPRSYATINVSCDKLNRQ
jgi:hypothetical protein